MQLKLRAPYENLVTAANFITLCSLTCAILIISRALSGELAFLGTLFIACLVCDGADGFVARKTGKSSDLGTQLDSLSDAIAFGVAPVVVADVYLRSIGAEVFLPAQIAFCACAVMRLAMFNVQKDKSIFLGLNTPSAASLVVLLIVIGRYSGATWPPGTMQHVINAMLFVLAASMISPFRYLSSKSLKLRLNATTVVIGAVFVVGSIWASPWSVYAYLVIYALSGPITATWLLLRRLRRPRSPRQPPR